MDARHGLLISTGLAALAVGGALAWMGAGGEEHPAEIGPVRASAGDDGAREEDPPAFDGARDGGAPAQGLVAAGGEPAREERQVEAPEAPAAAPPEERPLHGVLLDAATGEAVPHQSLMVHELRWGTGPTGRASPYVARTSRPLLTDSQGRFATQVEFQLGCRVGGTWVPAGTDPPALPVFLGEELRLHTRVGPTYRLALSMPSDVDPSGLRAALCEGDPRAPGVLRRAVADVTGGPEPWVRFAWSSAVDRERGERRWLEVATADGLLTGAAEVVLRPGVYPERVGIELAPFALLVGRVLDADEGPVSGAEVRLDDGPGDLPPLLATSMSTGEFGFERLLPGTWNVSVRAAAYEPLERVVFLAGGAETELDLHLSPLPPGGDVSGALRSATGTHRPEAIVYLDALEAPFGAFEARVEWTRGKDGWAGRFAFEDLPAGVYAPQLLTDDWFDWDGPVEPLRPPRAGLDYSCDDDVPLADLALDAVDAGSGGSVGSFAGWWLAPMDQEEFSGESGQPVVLVERYPAARALRWFAWADGYGVAHGDADSFKAGDGRVRVARAHLQGGWGAVLVAWDQNDHPLPGVRAVLDGRVAGTTDGDGVLVLSGPGPPTTFEFEHAHEVWVDGALAPGARAFPANERRIELFFAPR